MSVLQDKVLQDKVDVAGLAHKWIVRSTMLLGLLVTKITLKCDEEQFSSIVYCAVVKPTCLDKVYAVEVNGIKLQHVDGYREAVMAAVEELIKFAGFCEILSDGRCR